MITEFDDVVRQVRPDALRSYLEWHDWQKVSDAYHNDIYQTMSPGENRLQILVPGSNETEDLYRRIADALRILTALERLSGGDLVREIMQLSSDVILWRVPIRDDAGIPLDVAARVVKGMEELLVYGATNETEEPRPAIGRRTKLAQDYLSSCTLGHTRPGSFIFEFTSPVNSMAAHSECSVWTTCR